MVDIEAANIQTTATGGKGGTGDRGGMYSNKGDGGDGGDGGNAYAYGVQSSGGTVTAATDKITAMASGGMAGVAGSGNNGGVAGTAGAIGAEAKATAFMQSRMPLSTCMPKVLAPSRLALRQITLKTPKPMQCMLIRRQ